MAEVLNARLAHSAEVRADELARYDLIGFGSGIYYGRHHRALRRFVKHMPRLHKDAFVFSTCGAGRNQNGRLIRRLKRKGLRIKGDFFCSGGEISARLSDRCRHAKGDDILSAFRNTVSGDRDAPRATAPARRMKLAMPSIFAAFCFGSRLAKNRRRDPHEI